MCPKAPGVLFDNRSTYFNGADDDYQRPTSARLSSGNMSRQLTNLSLNQSVCQLKTHYSIKKFIPFRKYRQ
jgi:hypothetical protein